jgi:hypothetical protein
VHARVRLQVPTLPTVSYWYHAWYRAWYRASCDGALFVCPALPRFTREHTASGASWTCPAQGKHPLRKPRPGNASRAPQCEPMRAADGLSRGPAVCAVVGFHRECHPAMLDVSFSSLPASKLRRGVLGRHRAPCKQHLTPYSCSSARPTLRYAGNMLSRQESNPRGGKGARIPDALSWTRLTPAQRSWKM